MHKTSLALTGGFFALFFLLTGGGCAASPQPAPLGQRGIQAADSEPGKPPNYAESRPQALNREELTVSFTLEDLQLDFRASYLASEAQIYTGLFEGLFSYHPLTMEPIPAVAESWKISDDRKTWTFTLRQDAYYWNGDHVKSEDFRAAWISLLEPARDSPYSSLFDIIAGSRDFRTGTVKDPSNIGIECPNARTLIVKLNSPASFFPSMLCHHSFSPIHPSLLGIADWSTNLPVSNGPYRIASMNAETMVLDKNDRYWDAESVKLKRIILVNPRDGDDAVDMWNTGKARWIADDMNLDALTDRSGIVVNPLFATHYYFIRSVKKPYNDSTVRRALAMALPWEELRENYFLPATTLVYPIPGYPEIEGFSEPNLSEAKTLLEKAGFAGGAGLPELVVRISASEESARIAGLMVSAWKDGLGVPVKVDIAETGRYFEALRRGDYDVGFTTWIGDFADPYTFLQMWRADSNLNDARFNDAEYERLMERSMTEEGAERWATLAEAEKLLLDSGAVLPISFSPAVNIIDTNEIDGWYPNVLNLHPFKHLSYKAFRPLPGVVTAPSPSTFHRATWRR